MTWLTYDLDFIIVQTNLSLKLSVRAIATKILNQNKLTPKLTGGCIFPHPLEYENSVLDSRHGPEQPLKISAVKFFFQVNGIFMSLFTVPIMNSRFLFRTTVRWFKCTVTLDAITLLLFILLLLLGCGHEILT